jgi:hypothetical protein
MNIITKITVLALIAIFAVTSINSVDAFVIRSIQTGTYIDHTAGTLKTGTTLKVTVHDDEPNDIYHYRYLVLSETVYLIPEWTLYVKYWWYLDLINDGTYENFKRYLVNSGIAKLV